MADENLFQEFSLDEDDQFLNSLDIVESGTTQTVEETPPAADTLNSELQDFDLEGKEDLQPVVNNKETTTQPNTEAATTSTENVETTTEQSTTTEGQNPPATQEESSLYAPLASALFEQGVLPEDAVEKVKTAENPQEALFEAMQGQVDAGIESFVTSLPDKFKEQLLAHQKGVDLDTYSQAQAQRLKLENITEDSLKENVSLQKEIAKANLLRKGFSEEKATKYIDNWESLNELESEAADAFIEEKALAKKAEEQLVINAENARIHAEKARQDTIANLTQTLEDTTEIIPGKKLNKISREKVLNSMTQIVGRDQNGNPVNAVMQTRSKDPIKFEQTLHYLHSLGVFEGDWSSLVKTAKTNAINDLDTKMKEVYNFQGKQAGPSTTKEEGGSVLDAL